MVPICKNSQFVNLALSMNNLFKKFHTFAPNIRHDIASAMI